MSENITLLTPKGEFNNNLFYDKGMVVYSGYSIYVSLVDDNNAELTNRESWALLMDGSKIGTAIAEVNDLNNNAGYRALVNKVNTLLAEYAKNEQSYSDTFNKNETKRQEDWYNQLTTDEEQYQKKYQDILDQYNSWIGNANKNTTDRENEYNDLKSAMWVLQSNIVNLNDRATKNLQNAEAATTKANAAQALAEGAVNNANTAASGANTAAQRALDAANSVEESIDGAKKAAASCTEAVKSAVEAKSVCEAAANDATKAMDEAKTSAEKANKAADNANTAKEEAATATMNCQGVTEEAKKAKNDATDAAAAANDAANKANLATKDVTKAIDNAELAKTEAEKAARAASDATKETEAAKDTALEVANHPTYVGDDYFVYKYNLADKQYERTKIYVKGAAFKYSDFTEQQLKDLQGKAPKVDTSSTNPNVKTWWEWDSTANDGNGGYVDTGINPSTTLTKELIESLLTGDITTHTHSQYLTTTSAADTYATKTDVAANTAAIAIINGDKDTEGSIKKAIANLVDGAPEAYDTLKEIADYIADDKNAATAITKSLASKVSFEEVK